MTTISSTPSTTTSSILECKDTSEKIVLCESHSIYIKPLAKLNITIQLPPTKTAGQTVSSAEIIDKLRKHSLPEEYLMLRIIKSTLEFIRFEAEIENKSALKALLSKLDNSTIKMPSFTDVLKIRVAESKIVYPLKHDWDTFYNCVNANVNDLKPGERPDTIHIQDLPCKWFSDKKSFDHKKPSETILKEVFSIFGEIRCIDIPALYSQKFYQQKSDVFDAYIQYKEYFSFVKAMDTFRGMKMLHMDSETKQFFTANIRVDFDRTKHLSEREIQKRSIDRLKAIELEKIKNAQLEKEKDKATKKQEIANYKQLLEESTNKDENTSDKSMDETKTKEQRRKEREEIRRKKRIGKKQAEEERKLTLKIAIEERKILIAQRKLESMRLFEELFNRVKNSIFHDEPQKKPDETIKTEVATLDVETKIVEDKTDAIIDKESEIEEKKGEILEISKEVECIPEEAIEVENGGNKEALKENKSSPSRKEKRKEKKEKKRKRQETEKEEHDLREKILRLKQKEDNSEDNIDEREDLRKRISGTKIIKISLGNESDSSENLYKIDQNDPRKSSPIID